MTIAELSIFASVMLYLLTILPAKWISARQAGRFDNSRPRDPGFYDGGIRERVLGAHQNGIEAFPFFAAAVLLAEFREAPQNLINELAVLFLIVRTAYVLTYVGNRPTLRSILWAIGFLITVAIFFLPLIRNYLPV
ncbi:MAPEG family protein [Bradyrhizobium oligotrophicum]|uniref:MAPEG family protein n=1 Tax=Bradyrhizobium oligotrophicum TaxID=44255 RepID=UPI003EB9396C